MKEVSSPWSHLAAYTAARVGIGRTGVSIPTRAHLEFLLDHARARDAVGTTFEAEAVAREIASVTGKSVLLLESSACDRAEFLRRPDLGRRLSERSREVVEKESRDSQADISITVSDGLSARAIHDHAARFLDVWIGQQSGSFSFAPIAVLRFGRVAVADEIGELFRAKISVVLIGERPGLKSPNSMGIYLTYGPTVGSTDERRNCISNVREGGLTLERAASKLNYLIRESLSQKISGVSLKDEEALPPRKMPEIQGENAGG